MRTGRPAAVVQRGLGAGRPPPTPERQPLDDPGIGGGLADEQVLGNPLVSVPLLSQQLSGTAVATSAFGGGELRIDPAADNRMAERQRPAGLHDPRGRQQLGCLSCLDLFEASESRRLE